MIPRVIPCPQAETDRSKVAATMSHFEFVVLRIDSEYLSG
jgi:hypothetical protein